MRWRWSSRYIPATMTREAPPTLLNDDGTASVATTLMMSHHGFRRDIALFGIALRRVAEGDHSRVAALQQEWKSYHFTLHEHHEAEDQWIFPQLRSQHSSLGPVLDQLTSDHRRIDPLLEQGDRAFGQLPETGAAAALVSELSRLLDPHLATEEAQVIPFLRQAKAFPPPQTDAEAEMYAEGFAWGSHGVAPEVLTRVHALLPETVISRLPAARTAFEERCVRAWGSAKTGASRTAIPDWLTGR
jgi:Hemerythrin HHE cation binding domain